MKHLNQNFKAFLSVYVLHSSFSSTVHNLNINISQCQTLS